MALTRIAPAGIGTTPEGSGFNIGDSNLHSLGLDATNANFTGIVTSQNIRVIGDLQVDGTTTTLDTVVTEVDKLEVGANNTTVGVAITQSGTGDILNLYDGATEVFSVADGGNVNIGTGITANSTGINVTGVITATSFSGIDSDKISEGNTEVETVDTGSDGHIKFTTEGTERLRITSDGKFGIGTDVPSEMLDIVGGDIQVSCATTTSTDWSIIRVKKAEGSGIIDFLDEGAGVTTSDNPQYLVGRKWNERRDSLAIWRYTASGGSGGHQASDVLLQSSGDVYVRNKLGIGLTNPSAELEVRGAADTPTLTWNGSGQTIIGDTANQLAIGRVNSSPFSLYLQGRASNNAARNIILNPDGGNVGIGTDDPGTKLHVHGNGNESITLRLKQGTTPGNYSSLQVGRTDGAGNPHVTDAVTGGIPISGIPGILLGSSNTNVPAVSIQSANTANGHIVFSPKGTEKVRITSDGDVGIGENSPADRLVVQKANANGDVAVRIKNDTTTDGSASTPTTASLYLNTSTSDFNSFYIQARRYDNDTHFGYADPRTSGHVPSMVITNDRKTLIGGGTASYSDYNGTNGGWNGGHFINVGGSTQWGTLHIADWDDDTTKDSYGGTNIFLSRCKSETIGDHTGGSLAANNPIARLLFNGSDGAAFRNAAWIECKIDGTPGSNNMPGLLSFATSSGSGAAPVERLRIDSTGNIRIMTANGQLKWIASSGNDPFIRSIGSNQQELEFNTGGSERIRLKSDGTVLMGGQTSSYDGGFVNLELRTDSNTVGGSMTLVNATASQSGATCEIDCFQNYRGAGKIVFGRENSNNWQSSASSAASFLGFHTNNAGSVAERMRITSGGRLLIGHNSARSNIKDLSTDNVTPTLQFETSNVDANKDMALIYGRNNSNGADLIFCKHRNASTGGTTIVADDDRCGSISFNGSDGTTFRPIAGIRGRVDGTPVAGGSVPGRIEFLTATPAVLTPNIAMTVTSGNGTQAADSLAADGQVLINTQTPFANENFKVQSFASSTSGTNYCAYFDLNQNGYKPSNTSFGLVSNVHSFGDRTAIYAETNGGWGNTNVAVHAKSGGGQYSQGIGVLAEISHTDANGPGWQPAIYAKGVSATNASSGGAGCAVFHLVNSQSAANPMNKCIDDYSGSNTRQWFTFQRNGSTIGSISHTSTSTAYNTSSDYRLKQNIVNLENAEQRLRQIPVRRFNFIKEPGVTMDGFLAHEVQPFVPESITGDKDGMKTEPKYDDQGNMVMENNEPVMHTIPDYQEMDQAKLVPLLTAALQEAFAKIDTLQERISALES